MVHIMYLMNSWSMLNPSVFWKNHTKFVELLGVQILVPASNMFTTQATAEGSRNKLNQAEIGHFGVNQK